MTLFVLYVALCVGVAWYVIWYRSSERRQPTIKRKDCRAFAHEIERCDDVVAAAKGRR